MQIKARLTREFFARDTRIVAQELLGKILSFQHHKILINETEAYLGFDDPASHAARGKTPRSLLMYGPAGFSYVYLIYGMYHCFNITTEVEGFPAAVLIRGGYLLDQNNEIVSNLNGPGKLCRHLQMTKAHNGIDIITAEDFFVQNSDYVCEYIATPRIGIKVGLDKFWRFHKIRGQSDS